MTDDDLKRLIEETAGDTRRHVELIIEGTHKKVDDLQRHVEETNKKFDGLQSHVEGTNKRVDDLQRHVELAAERTDKKIDDLRRHFDVVAEGMQTKIELLAEGQVSLGDELRTDIQSLREETHQGFADTQAMIRFSHAELDRRLRTLEEVVANLQSRVERLESTTH